jgi:hypothetical protein
MCADMSPDYSICNRRCILEPFVVITRPAPAMTLPHNHIVNYRMLYGVAGRQPIYGQSKPWNIHYILMLYICIRMVVMCVCCKYFFDFDIHVILPFWKIFIKMNNLCMLFLGTEFGYDGDSWLAQADVYKKELKAYFKLIRSLKPPPKPHISLLTFDHLIKSIWFVGCEIWTKIQVKLNNGRENFICDSIFSVKNSLKSTNFAIYVEPERYPLFIDRIRPCIKYENELLETWIIQYVESCITRQ